MSPSPAPGALALPRSLLTVTHFSLTDPGGEEGGHGERPSTKEVSPVVPSCRALILSEQDPPLPCV